MRALTPSILLHTCAYKNGDFTDLIVTCGPLKFEVHKLVVCSISDFFKDSLGTAVDEETGKKCIALPEDDPEMVRRLISYMYLRDYDPNGGLDIVKFNDIKQFESTTVLASTHHQQVSKCSCLAPSPKNLKQPLRAYTPVPLLLGDTKVIPRFNDTAEVANPLTIHTTMYALGDKYGVQGLCDLAKEKFESCLDLHVHSEDFTTAIQLAYSTTPDSNRGLRDVIVEAFRRYFNLRLAEMPGVEAKLDSLDKLSMLLIKSWPVKTELAERDSMGFSSSPAGAPVAGPKPSLSSTTSDPCVSFEDAHVST
ncbi:hypothetical protein GQ44DRAFT_740330 [Phaeosphaeriaceae sp. PMI808]|nr:hypothetical protein GQ44DRAFT_740330 [Phaeosphaeriaceae sp. PMI808]